MLRNSASGPEIGLPGRILAGLLPGNHRNRPSPISRPEALLRNIEYRLAENVLWQLVRLLGVYPGVPGSDWICLGITGCSPVYLDVHRFHWFHPGAPVHTRAYQSEGSRNGFLAKCFLEAWATKAKKTHLREEKSGFLAR